MSKFDELHGNNENYLFSKEIDEYLVSLGYDYNGGVQGDHTSPIDGLSKWYTDYMPGDLYHTHVAIFPDHISLYQEYNCGGLIRKGKEDITDWNTSNLNSFKENLVQFFDEHDYYFGG